MEVKLMKSLTGKSLLWRVVGSVALVAVVLSSVMFAGAAPTLAARDDVPSVVQEEIGEGRALRLEFAYLRLQHAVEDLALHLGHADEVADFVQGWVDELAADEKDVSGLQAGLDAFEAKLAEARGHYETAKAVLDEHAGFDEDGKVTDRDVARETLRAAGRSLRDARRALKDGAIELRRAVRDWRHEQQPRPTDS
jgi:hypothetical protein